MKHLIGTKVVVSKATDETFDWDFINKQGIVSSHNANGMSGNTEDDPLHVVHFAGNIIEDFWYEELTPVFTQQEGA